MGMTWWTQQAHHEKNCYVHKLLMQIAINPDKREYAAQTVMRSIENTLQDERGRWILHAHRDAKSEFALTSVVNNEIENIVIDRMFIDENNILWIIDYKTTAFSHEDKEKFLSREKKKYAEQMQKYRQVLSARHEGEIRLGLYFPAIPAWDASI
jgi:hypothetical protein